MKLSSKIKKAASLMLASVSVLALAGAPALAASSEKTIDASQVKIISVQDNAETLNIKASTDNNMHISATNGTFEVTENNGSIVVSFQGGEKSSGTILIPNSKTDAIFKLTANNNAKGVNLENINFASISMKTKTADINATNLSSNKRVNIITDSGNVKISDSDLVDGGVVRSTYGDVEVALKTAKTRSVGTNKVRVISAKGKATLK